MKKELLKKVKSTNFENDFVSDFVSTIVSGVDQFQDRKQGGPAFKAILMTFANVFVEDRHKIYAILGGPVAKKRQQGGGANIVRGKSLAAVRKRRSGGCDNCPDSATSDQLPIEVRAPVIPVKGKPKTQEISGRSFNTIEEVLDVFQGSSTSIIAWAQANDIYIPASVSRARTAAKYVVEHFQNDEEE